MKPEESRTAPRSMSHLLRLALILVGLVAVVLTSVGAAFLFHRAFAAQVDRVAAAVNLSDELDKRLSAYSGGMKQRLLLASALLGDPKLLILDEPTAGLDPKERVRLRELLAAMAADRIILVATHVVSDVESVAAKVILLRAGQIVDAAPVPELIEKYAPGRGLEDVYLHVFGEGDGK